MPKLTKSHIEKLPIPSREEGPYIEWDAALAGYGIRVMPSGVKTFIVKYRGEANENGNRIQRKTSLGRFPTKTESDARREAAKYINAAADNIDRVAERQREAKEAARRAALATSVDDVASGWLKLKLPTLKGRHKRREYEALYRNHVSPEIGSMEIADVRRSDILRLVRGVAESHPRTASQVLSVARQLMEHAANEDMVAYNPVAGLKPSSLMVKIGHSDRARVLDAEEIVDFWSGDMPLQMHRLLKLVLVTGQRPGEVAGMRESEIDDRVWTIPGNRRKGGVSNKVYLTDTARGLIEEAKVARDQLRKRRSVRPSDLIFESSTGKTITQAAPSKAVKRAVDGIGNKDKPEEGGHWTPHDLRRTMRTGLTAAEVSEEVAEALIGHGSKDKIVRVYNRHNYLPQKKRAAEAWESRLLAILECEDPDTRQRAVAKFNAID